MVIDSSHPKTPPVALTADARHTRRRLVLEIASLASALLLVACGTGSNALRPLLDTTPGDEAVIASGKVSSSSVGSKRLFYHFSDLVAGERFIKFVIDVKRDKIEYFNVRTYPMHTDFVFKEIYREEITVERLADFMSNYSEEKPHFVLGYLVHHLDQDVWTFSYWEDDRTSPKYVEWTYRLLKLSFFAADRIAFRPDSMFQEDVAEALKGVPVITNDTIYKMATYHTFNPGESVGRLRIVRPADLKDLNYSSDQIVILKAIVPNITVVAGIVSEQFSTPLSHVALRARAWNVPHAGLKNASEKYEHLEGEMVVLTANSKEVVLRLASDDEIAKFEAKREKKREVRIPEANLNEMGLKGLEDIQATEVRAYGAKTANLGEIVRARRPGINVPPGFGVPIIYYDQHMKAHGLYKRAHGLLKDSEFQKDPRLRRRKLKELRTAIRTAALDPALLEEIWKRARPLLAGGSRGLFVRSSTNAEDLPGFNGAGLYDTVPNVKTKKTLGTAIKQVWASVWNFRAVEERTFHGIDHRGVYGSVLVQLAVNATAAGVLVTRNIFSPRQKGVYTINAKWGLGMKVVEGKETPEQLLVEVNTGQIKVVSRSDDKTMLVFDEKGGVKEIATKQEGRAVLTHKRAIKLANAAKELVAIFGESPPLDVEWLFVGDELHIVQARPFVTR